MRIVAGPSTQDVVIKRVFSLLGLQQFVYVPQVKGTGVLHLEICNMGVSNAFTVTMVH
jgi:hypothetical protein